VRFLAARANHASAPGHGQVRAGAARRRRTGPGPCRAARWQSSSWARRSESPVCGRTVRGMRRCGRRAGSFETPRAIAIRRPRCSRRPPNGSRPSAALAMKRAAGRKLAGDRCRTPGHARPGLCLTNKVRWPHVDHNRLIQGSGRDSPPFTGEAPADIRHATPDQRDEQGPGPVTRQARTAFSAPGRMAGAARIRERDGGAEAAPGRAPA